MFLKTCSSVKTKVKKKEKDKIRGSSANKTDPKIGQSEMKTKLYCLHRRIGQKNLRTEKDFRKAKAKKLKKLTIILIIKSTLVDLRIVWS